MKRWLAILILMVFCIIMMFLNIGLSMENSRLKLQYQEIIKYPPIDTVSTSTYLQKIRKAYNGADWDSVTINVRKYEDKIKIIHEDENISVYIYSGYAYFKLATKPNNQNIIFLLDTGFSEIDKYISSITNNSTAYFIKGLILMSYPKNYENYSKKLSDSLIAFNKAKKYTVKDSNDDKNIEKHIKLTNELILEETKKNTNRTH